MEVNSKNREKTISKHENYSSTKELLNKIKCSTSYEDIRTVNGISYTTFEDAYNALLI